MGISGQTIERVGEGAEEKKKWKGMTFSLTHDLNTVTVIAVYGSNEYAKTRSKNCQIQAFEKYCFVVHHKSGE